jgi:DNA polymerase (family 10)
MENKEISDLFNEIAAMLSIDETPNSKFEVRAYQKAALTIGTLQEAVEDIYKEGGIDALMELPGIGKGLAAKIEEYIKTGKIKKYEELKKKYPIDIKQLTSIAGLGAKKAARLYKELKVKDIPTLKKAINQHRISKLEGFGAKSEEAIGKGITLLEAGKGRILLGDALPIAEEIVAQLTRSRLAEKVVIAGSARRMRETVGDLDILALSDKPAEVMDLFSSLPEVSSVMVKGPTKTTVWLKSGISCDLRVIAPESFGAALQYFTGNKDHNIQVRKIAIGKGYKLNEYGLFDRRNKIIPTRNEEEIYAKLGMQYMPPEMRESRGEVKLSLEHRIPKIVELDDMKGDMHSHSNVSTDAASTIEEMAQAAIDAKLEYFASTNHTKSLRVVNGMDDKRFAEFFKRIDKLNDSLDGKLRILKGAEVDILKDGSLDLSDATLKGMDYALGAVHSSFNMTEEAMTSRIIKAMDSGLLMALAHPTGREIGIREAYPLNMEKIFEAAERNNVAMEINSQPLRLDLNDTNIMKASQYKIRFAIGSDSHITSQIGFLKYGVATARRGWLTKDRIINTMPLKELSKILPK